MKLIIKTKQPTYYKYFKKINIGQSTFIVQDKKNRFKFCADISFPHLNGSIFLGEITGINNKIKAAFVKFGKYTGILSFFSIHPSYLINSKELINKINAEDLKSFRKSPIYQSIDFEKSLKIGQKILVQVINIYTNKGIKLSTFISLYANYVKYIPNSLKPLIICNKYNNIKEYIKLMKIPGSIITNRYAKEENVIKNFENLVQNWEKIQNKYYYMLAKNQCGLIFSADPINSLFNKFPIKKILCTNRIHLAYLRHQYNVHITHIKKNIFEKEYSSIIEQLTKDRIHINNYAINFFYSSTGTEITTSINYNNNFNQIYNLMNTISNQIILRNIGGLIFIPIYNNNHRNSEDIFNLFQKNFKKDSVYIYSHCFSTKRGDIVIYIISKQYRYHLIKPYKISVNKNRNKEINMKESGHYTNKEEKINLEDDSFLLINDKSHRDLAINERQQVHIDVNRGKSNHSNEIINEQAINMIIEYLDYKQYRGLIYIDLLDSSFENLKKLQNILNEKLQNIQSKIFPLSILVCHMY